MFQLLLEHGADLRIMDQNNQQPEHVAANEELKHMLVTWDMDKTENKLINLEEERAKRLQNEQTKRQYEIKKYGFLIVS